MIWLLLLLLAMATALAVALYWALDERDLQRRARERAEAALVQSNERIHAISNSALAGHPLVKWRHPNPMPASDAWYWRARFAGRNALFTEEAVRTAFLRGDLHFPKH